ncbi:ATP-binding protein [Streptomyces orinoci]|uniref:ATP-binding protein n=1 Tax=Streptomyces orinoci TaxID=67339 RepID=A0ABV3JTP6_STRON|nr:ATP-binding protein [Streptomyces orinoci]
MNDPTQLPLFGKRFGRRSSKAVPLAREFAHRTLAVWQVRRADDVLLCVSELATNALRHGVPPGREFLLHLWLLEDRTLRVEVHDSGPGFPRVLAPAVGEQESGRGLVLVDALADKWGVGERDPGKVVWCEFADAVAW